MYADLICFYFDAILLRFTQVIVEGETTTADNQSILPSKKRLTRAVKSTSTTPTKRKLTKKERKRLEKVLDVKKKKAQVSWFEQENDQPV